MKILVTFAIEQEFAPWRRLRDFRPVRRQREVRGYVAELPGAELFVLLTGIGGTAGAHLNKMMSVRDFDFVISSGLAGALKNEHSPAEVLAAREVCAEKDGERARSDERLLQLARKLGAKIVERFCTSDRIVVSTAEKRCLGKLADAVEMESLPIMSEAPAWGAKAIAIRAVSDAADEDLPVDLNRLVDRRGDVSVGRVVNAAVKNPGAIPALLRFGRQSRRAAAQLAQFLDGYVQAVPAALHAKQLAVTR